MRHIGRGSEYLRVADPSWEDPLSGEHAREHGGRWNAPRAFAVVYLNATVEVARAQVRRKLEPRGIRPEDLDPATGPVLVRAVVPHHDYVDAVTDRGLGALGLPASYPHDAHGKTVPHSACQPIGKRAHDAGEPGIACRSAAPTAPPFGEELAYFGHEPLEASAVEGLADWYW